MKAKNIENAVQYSALYLVVIPFNRDILVECTHPANSGGRLPCGARGTVLRSNGSHFTEGLNYDFEGCVGCTNINSIEEFKG